MELGAYFRDRRAVRGLSLRALAALAGVSKSALAEWEAGRSEPSLPEFDAVLRVYGATGEERDSLLRRMSAPRARRAVRSALVGTERRDEALPETAGLVLRTLRLRRALTPEDFAARLGVTPSTLWRWERGDILPSVERLGAVADVIGAAPLEREALLSAERARGASPPPDLAQIAHGLELFERRRWNSVPMPDLRLLGILGELRPLLPASGTARELHRRACVLLVYLFFTEFGSLETAVPFARLALQGDEGILTLKATVWPVQILAHELSARGREGRRQSLDLLRDWLPRFEPSPHSANWIRRSIAELIGEAGDFDEALRLSAETCRSEREFERDVRHVDFDHAKLLLRAGRPEEALATLPAMEVGAPLQMALEGLAWGEGLLAVGERQGAEHAFGTVRALTLSHGLPTIRRTLGALERRLEGRQP